MELTNTIPGTFEQEDEIIEINGRQYKLVRPPQLHPDPLVRAFYMVNSFRWMIKNGDSTFDGKSYSPRKFIAERGKELEEALGLYSKEIHKLLRERWTCF